MSRFDLGRPSPISGDPTTEGHHIEPARNMGRRIINLSNLDHALAHEVMEEITGDPQHGMDVRSRVGKMDPVERRKFEILRKDNEKRDQMKTLLGF